MTTELTRLADRALPGDEPVTHAWPGVVGPRPSILTLLSAALIVGIFAHLVFPLPAWWPYGFGIVAIVVNLMIAVWQAFSIRVVAVTSTGIHVLKKAPWANHLTQIVGSMPRMPLGPLIGRWSLLSVANTEMWVHHRHQGLVEAFDDEYRGRFDLRPTTGVLAD
ncbi:MAG: hypothetical protein AAF547_23795 [Actinomycetota bacterium]